MPLDRLRLRATEALRLLEIAQTVAAPSEFKVGPLCEALLAVRDLLQCYGDANVIVPTDQQGKKSAAVLQLLAKELPHLVTALEIVSTRSELLLELDGKRGQARDGRGSSVVVTDGDGRDHSGSD